MSEDETELDRLFGAMADQAPVSEPAGERARRRERAIGGMRALQLGLSRDHDQSFARRRRRYWVAGAAAAALMLAGVAFAATTGAWPFARPSGGAETALARSPGALAGEPRQLSAAPPQPLVEQAPPAPAPPHVEQAAGASEATPKTIAKAAELAAPRAELEEVNRLFAEAKLARRQHRDADALQLLQRLLAKYPRSVLSQEASVERFRALARLGRTSEAERYAKAYLAAYPQGFAAEEAQRLSGRREEP